VEENGRREARGREDCSS